MNLNFINNQIGEHEINYAIKTLQKYKAAKQNLEARVKENENWFRLRHWEQLRKNQRVKRHSAWLFNSIINKHADFMDCIPTCTVLPKEECDSFEAERLTSIIPSVLEQNNFTSVYSDASYKKLKTGTAIYSVLWNSDSNGGLGEIDIKTVDILNLFWEPGIKDIQNSRNIFHLDLVDNDILLEEYPFLNGKLNSSSLSYMTYCFDDNIDTSEKSCVVDWYYKKKRNNKVLVHYCKFVNSTLIYASENDINYCNRGWYDHGKYPFVFDTLFREEGTPIGFGFIDVMKETQEEIDILSNEITRNAIMGAKKRYFTRIEGAVNEEEFADFNKDFIHVNGSSIGEDSIREINFTPLSEVYVKVLNNKITELKETSSNRDFSQGGTLGGVTSGAAISALQEAGNKTSRDMISETYNAFNNICMLVIELIRQFYVIPRSIRFTGKNGENMFSIYDNSYLKGIALNDEFGMDYGIREPHFDVSVRSYKQSDYSRTLQNSEALNFYSIGFFAPEKAKQSLACLEIMDIENKEKLKEIITKNMKLSDGKEEYNDNNYSGYGK